MMTTTQMLMKMMMILMMKMMMMMSHWAFCVVAGPIDWNSIPLEICSAPYIINVQKYAQDTSVLSFLLH